MKISGPDRYRLEFESQTFRVISPQGTNKFSGKAASKIHKLYVVSSDGLPVYVGVTKQSMRNRLRYGWKAAGRGGYYGYAWRNELTEADLDIWYHENPPDKISMLDIETVEAEVVHLIRQSGQWPRYQTEIHFHPSDETHRAVAKKIFGHYKIPTTAPNIKLKPKL